jgi:putative NADPH-quinone reductase
MAMKDASRDGGSLHGKGRRIVINIGKPIEEYRYRGHERLEREQPFKRVRTETLS